eukprot:CAMPEP_0172621568 /NCGR_PEP_ID=MMETSP1068-20121228/113315_1 /TAXON_ID=35684 /ORGANISM="Pseudopedinella elastica, Strain CCMP716" /LENGTH=125 /DNA_ID=CAMNT_0013429375 /DNA_START=87 /DNA_END=464 /DNA_ORIENTATION=-
MLCASGLLCLDLLKELAHGPKPGRYPTGDGERHGRGVLGSLVRKPCKKLVEIDGAGPVLVHHFEGVLDELKGHIEQGPAADEGPELEAVDLARRVLVVHVEGFFDLLPKAGCWSEPPPLAFLEPV